MTTTRLFTYAVSGIIAGLLVENVTIRWKYRAAEKAKKSITAKKLKVEKKMNGVLHPA